MIQIIEIQFSNGFISLERISCFEINLGSEEVSDN